MDLIIFYHTDSKFAHTHTHKHTTKTNISEAFGTLTDAPKERDTWGIYPTLTLPGQPMRSRYDTLSLS